MIDKKDFKKIEKIIKEFFEKATFDMSYEVSETADGAVLIAIESQEPQIYIGERGQTLSEIQKLLAKIVRKQVGAELYLKIDINGYRANKERHLQEMAQEIADQVALAGTERLLNPMSSYERRVIHTALAERSDIKTESVGEEGARRVAVKPA